MLRVRPISIAQANAYVEKYHRHHGKRVGVRFAIACYEGDELHGVAICANPVARKSDDGLTLEVARLCTDGTHNACSILYGACARVAKDMGFTKIQTFILESEPGTSLKACGWVCEGVAGESVNWENKKGKRVTKRTQYKQMEMFETKKPPEERKQRWARYFEGG